MIRNFTTLKTANGFWIIDKILPDDTSVAAYTVRALAFINFVYHYENPAAMEKPELYKKFIEADNILKGLKYKVNIIDVKTMSLDQKIPLLKALNDQVQIQTNRLPHADNASNKRLTIDVSKLQVEVSALAKQADQRMDRLHKVILDLESIKNEMNREEWEEIVNQPKNKKKQQQKKSK